MPTSTMGKRSASENKPESASKRPKQNVREETDDLEDGFVPPADFAAVEYTGTTTVVPDGAKLLLLRLPVDVDPQSLSGNTIDLQKLTTLDISNGEGHTTHYNLQQTENANDSGFIVLSSQPRSARLRARQANAIAAQLSLTRTFKVPPPKQGSYAQPPVIQPPDMRQRWFPFGASQDVRAVRVKPPKPTKASKKEKVEITIDLIEEDNEQQLQEEEDMDSMSVEHAAIASNTMVMETEGVKEKSKKDKESKKEKKSKKDKKEKKKSTKKEKKSKKDKA